MFHYGSLNATHALIFLHGYMQDAQNMRSCFSSAISIDFLQNVSLVVFFPNFRLYTYINEETHDYIPDTLYNLRKRIHSLITNVEKNYSVILGGYSQGACAILDAAFTYQHKLPVISCSGFALKPDIVHPGETYQTKLDLFYTHGTDDAVIPLDMAQKSYMQESSTHCIFNGSHWQFWSDRNFQTFMSNFLKMQTS